MMAKTAVDPGRQHSLRIELAVRSDIERFLRAAVRLAKMMDSPLEVVFRQDREMLDAAALPFVQEVCLWTGQERLTSRSLLASSMRIQARQTHKLLAHIAEHEAVAYSFTAEQDASQAPGAAAASSVQWVGGRCLSTRTEHCPVCVLTDDQACGRESLRQASEFARRSGRGLKVYHLGEPLAAEGLEGSVERVAVEDLHHWLQGVARIPCFVLFLPRHLYSSAEELKALHNVPYPVLLV